MSLNFVEEKKLWKKGYKCVVGLDEAGRGPLAGPVVAGAVALNFKYEILNLKSILNDKILKNIRDSKQLSPKKREELYNVITAHPGVEWGVGVVSEKIIDKINILEATKLAMQKAVCDANIRMHANDTNKNIDHILIDGNFSIKTKIPQKSIIKADEKVFSCAAASIIAKVTRDRIMRKEHKKYPEYGFENHKGYPTRAHFANLKKIGPCKIHRKSFNLKFKRA